MPSAICIIRTLSVLWCKKLQSSEKTALVFVNYIIGTILVDAAICYYKNNIVIKYSIFRPISRE